MVSSKKINKKGFPRISTTCFKTERYNTIYHRFHCGIIYHTNMNDNENITPITRYIQINVNFSKPDINSTRKTSGENSSLCFLSN